MGVLETLAAARPREESVKIITDAVLCAEWEALTEGLDEAAKKDARDGSLADLPATRERIEALEQLRDKVRATEVEFFFAKLDWTEHVQMQAAHPPIPGNVLHERTGYNVQAFTEALIRRSCVRVVGADGSESHEIPASTWDAMLGTPARPAVDDRPAQPRTPGSLNFGAVNQLAAKARKANEETAQVPPSARSLLGSQDSGASLAQPSPGTAPRRSGSAGGSRPT